MTGDTDPSSPHEPVEIELKLTADPAALDRLRSAAILSSENGRYGRAQMLRSQYFDTPGFDLWRRGVVLRVRRRGRSHLQTVKADGRGDRALLRHEWETVLPDGSPRIEALPEAVGRALLADVDTGHLAPRLVTNVRRELRLVKMADAVVEVAIDTGTIEAGGRREAIAEIEFELKEGHVAALYELALACLDSVPLRLGLRSKADRGFDLLVGEPPMPESFGRITLGAAVSTDMAFAAMLRRCQSHLLAALPAALDGRHPEGVHQARVALRRLRAVLWLIARIAPSAALQLLRDEAKRLAGAFGPARDRDVLIGHLDDIPFPAAGAAATRRALEEEREDAYRTVRTLLDDPETTRFVLTLGRWTERHGWRIDVDSTDLAVLAGPVQHFADIQLARAHRKVLKAGRGFAGLAVEERHSVRKELKKLRYLCDFFRPLYPSKRASRFLATLSGLQDAFGAYNDRAAAAAAFVRLAESARDPALLQALGFGTGWVERDRLTLEAPLIAGWEEFESAAPFWSDDRPA
jgi:triphosphatase